MQRTTRISIDSILCTYHDCFILILVHFYFTIVLIVSVGTTRLPRTSLRLCRTAVLSYGGLGPVPGSFKLAAFSPVFSPDLQG